MRNESVFVQVSSQRSERGERMIRGGVRGGTGGGGSGGGGGPRADHRNGNPLMIASQ